MKYIRNILLLLFLFFSSAIVHAEGEDWTFDSYGYRYDMTMYVALDVDNVVVKDFSRYKVGAFCKGKCCGILESKKIGNYTYGYLRIRSNSAEGEAIDFKVRDTVTGKVYDFPSAQTFKAYSSIGFPSSPYVFYVSDDVYLFGDVNGDGKVTIQDVALLVEYALHASDGIVWRRSDVDNNRVIDKVDIDAIVGCLLDN